MPKQTFSDQLHSAHVWITNWYPVLAVVLYAVVLGVGYVLLLRPMITSVIALQKDQLGALIENKDAVVYGKELENFIKKSDQFSKQNNDSLKQLTNFLPEKPTIPQLFTLFEYFFKENGFTVSKLDFNIRENFESKPLELGGKNGSNVVLPALDASVGVIDVSATVSGGGYVELKNMLTKMEKIGRLVDMSNLNIEAKTSADSTKTEYNLQMRTYYYRDN